MRTPMSLVEAAFVTSTGDPVRVLRRRSIRHDEQIMEALERTGHFVIGTPSGFRYRRKGARRFTRPEPSTVYLIDDDGKVTHALPGDYFTANYTVIPGGDS